VGLGLETCELGFGLDDFRISGLELGLGLGERVLGLATMVLLGETVSKR